MVVSLFISFMLVAFSVTVHASGITWSLRRLSHSTALAERGSWRQTMFLITTAGWLIILHLVQISLWGFAFRYGGAMPDLSTALYFSSVTYTTVGYGDVILPADWRLVGGVEALTGILMCGWSAGYFFALFTRMLQLRSSADNGK